MLPIPPIITTTSAFMVNSTPIDGLNVRKRAHERAGHRHQCAPARKRDRGHRGGIDADETRACRFDRERPHRGAEARAFEDQPDREPERTGDAEGQYAIGREGEAYDAHWRVEIIVETVVRRERELRRALEHEQQSEGRQDSVALEVVAGARSADQRQHEKAIDQPIGAERHRHGQQHAKDRIDGCEREHPECGKRRGHEKFAVGEIEDAGDAVLQIEADRDQGVEATKDHAAQNDFDQ
jgi:hypothetical protein